MSQLQLTDAQRLAVHGAVKDSLNHSVWRNIHGEIWTGCNTLVVSSTGFVRPEWAVSYPGEPRLTSFYCRACLQSR